MEIEDAHLDHIIPITRGGGIDIGNLRWVCSQANFAKRNLMDDEFIKLCSDVTEYIARDKGLEGEE